MRITNIVKYYDDGVKHSDRWFDRYDELHHETQPAHIEYYSTGHIMKELWRINGSLHREDGPAITEYHKNNELSTKSWYLKGHKHRFGFPAVIEFYENGNVEYEGYYMKGRRHNFDGPARIRYNEDGTVKKINWCLMDVEINFEEWLDMCNVSKERRVELKLTHR